MEIRKLNALRGLAALMVFITHFSDVTQWIDGSLGGRSGQYGVMLFFLLSGFLMAYLYIDKTFDKKNIKQYIFARVGRVLPLYFIVVFASYFLYSNGFHGLYEIADGKSLTAHLLFTFGESILWTIGPEIQFYFIFMLIWFLASWRPGYIYVFIIGVLITLFFTNFPRIHGDIQGVPYNFFHLLRSLPYFLIGVIFGIHYKAFKVPDYLRKNWFIATLLLIPLMYPEFSPVLSDAKMKMWLNYEVLLVMASVFFCIVFLVPDNNYLLANQIGDFLGKISYSLYLLHLPIITQVNKLNLSIELKLMLSILISIMFAYLSYRFIEKPSARIVRNLGNNKLGKKGPSKGAPA